MDGFNNEGVRYDDAPTLLIFGNDPGARAVAAEAVANVGGRVSAALPIAAAGGRLSAQVPEAPGQAEHWDTWFGMHAQWVPFWEVPERYTVASNDATGPVASE